MVAENGIFQTIEQSTLRHKSMIPNYPEVVDQVLRLEILNLLAILEAPHALEAIKVFLGEKKWKVTGLAAETLLGEGDEAAFEMVRGLLQDPDREIRVEAALVLASWAKDYSVIPILLDVYPTSDRQLQIKILESLGHIGDRQALPFLLERLSEPSQIMQLVAASALIRILHQ
jgi:HEAT repeat protein